MKALPWVQTSLMVRGASRHGLIVLVALVSIAGFAACSPTPTPVAVTPTTSPEGPDLTIPSFTITEEDWFLGLRANAQVVVRNQGTGPASPFEVAIVAVNREGNRVSFYFEYDPALLPAELGPGQEVTLTGATGLSWHGYFDVLCMGDTYDATQCAMHDDESVWLMALADYCEGEAMPAYCVVEELDETNNTKGPVVVKKE